MTRTRECRLTTSAGRRSRRALERFMSDAEDLPCDFLAYLERRLGVGSDDALSALANWIREYEPLVERDENGRELPAITAMVA